MESHSIPFSNGQIHYSIFGKGSSDVIAFHGFGQDGGVFQKVADRFPQYRFIAVDLPFHGKSMPLDSRNPIKSHQVVEMVTLISEEQKINRFSIISFSIGARFVWPLLDIFNQQLESVTLIAPDGLPTSAWYRLATFSQVSRWIFRQVMEKEGIITGIIKMARTFGITNRPTSVYLQKTVRTANMRRHIYNTWTALRFLEPDMAVITSVIMNNGTKVLIVLGEKDNLIDSKRISRRLKDIQGIEIVLLPCLHHQLLENYTAWKMEENIGKKA